MRIMNVPILMALLQSLIITLVPVNGQTLNDTWPAVPCAEIIVPIIDIQLKFISDLLFYDNSPREVKLIYEIFCYIPPETPPRVECEVVLVGTAEDFYVTPIDPLFFTYNIDTLQFTMEVIVPPDAAAFMDFNIVVSGTYDISPGQGEGEVTPYVVLMTIPSYGCLLLSAEAPDWNPPVGHWIDIEITIHNLANAEDRIVLDVFKGDPNVEVMFSEDTVDLNWGAQSKVHFIARQKGGLPGTNYITIRSRSSHQGLNATRYCEISFETKVSHKSFLAGPLIYIGGGSLLLLVILTLLIITVTLRWRRRKARNSRPL
jgi:hypothetical protein